METNASYSATKSEQDFSEKGKEKKKRYCHKTSRTLGHFGTDIFRFRFKLIYLLFQKLISDERFQSLVEGDVHRQLPVQFVNAVVSTPSMSDEIQVEIMKVR